jgi:hypothetical protein
LKRAGFPRAGAVVHPYFMPRLAIKGSKASGGRKPSGSCAQLVGNLGAIMCWLVRGGLQRSWTGGYNSDLGTAVKRDLDHARYKTLGPLKVHSMLQNQRADGDDKLTWYITLLRMW